MQCENEIPKMLRFLLGEAAEVGQAAASERLMGWCRGYEAWLEERGARSPSTHGPANRAWKGFLTRVKKMPWEITAEDVKAYAAWLQSREYAAKGIYGQIRYIFDFYRWCSQRGIDAECEAGFNPAQGILRLDVRPYQESKLLSRQEVERLVGFMRGDSSAIGRRDHAFVLARLRLGVSLRKLQKLQWGQIEQDGDGSLGDHSGPSAWVRWREDGEPCPLAEDAWEAIRAALQAGGRLESMQAQDHVFAPLAKTGVMDMGTQAGDWRADKHLSKRKLQNCLKIYGRPAGIPEEKLNLESLRLTAIRLWLDDGVDLQDENELRRFLDSRAPADGIRFRLRRLPQLPLDDNPLDGNRADGEPGAECVGQGSLPEHKLHHFQPGEGVTHGFFAHSQPPQAIEEMLRQDIHGIDEEFAWLRILGRGLLERQAKARSSQEIASLTEAYTLLAYRLGEMVKAEKELEKMGEENREADEYLDRVEQAARSSGFPLPEDWRQQIIWGDGEQAMASRHLAEEVAGLRYVIRNVFRLAMEAAGAAEVKAYIHLVDVYGSASVRLVRLLRSEGSYADRVDASINDAIDWALDVLIEEFDLTA